MNFRFYWITVVMCCLFNAALFAQEKAPDGWFNKGPEDSLPGVNVEKVYEELLPEGQKVQPVVVAVLDGGVDAEHEDLQDVMWKNPGEIPGNNQDDDDNGYVDDVHGWNFLGNADGANLQYANLEVTRLYKKYHEKFKDAQISRLSKKERQQYEAYQEYKEEIEKGKKKAKENLGLYAGLFEAFKALREAIDQEEITLEDINDFESEDPLLSRASLVAANFMQSEGVTFSEMFKMIEEGKEYFYSRYNYYYNPDFDASEVLGERGESPYYGNNDVEGPDASHGTHVAGIIAAVRDNGLGIDGIAVPVRIMSVRMVPDGDERDRDVANAIRYAVDNGAKVINMSFGKGHSPNKKMVDKAVKYARKNDVLIVHAAGNDGAENQADSNYPNDRFLKKGLFGPRYAPNWLEVGAADWRGGEQLAADFSNYSEKYVDLFAPGVDILSTVPDDQYEPKPGTSMAAPMVSGVAGMLRAYFPDLTAEQVREIIMKSVRIYPDQVQQPGDSEEMVPFGKLSQTGGIVDAYRAIILASRTKGKNGGKDRRIELAAEAATQDALEITP